MGATRRTTGMLALASLCACIADGRYLVRGTVITERGGAAGPLVNAKVAVWPAREERAATAGSEALSDADGKFEVRYPFGGPWFLFWGPGDGDPVLECSAPGYAPVRVQVRGDETPPGVARERCPEHPDACYAFRIVLAPE